MKKLIVFISALLIYSSIFHINCFGQWVVQTNPLGSGDEALVGKIQFVSSNEGWISAGNGSLLHTLNGGSNWTIVTPETIDTLFSWSDPAQSLSFINPSTGWVIRTKGSFSNWQGARVYKTINGGVNWNKLTIPNYDAGIYIQFVDANNGWIMIFNSNFTSGGLFKTINGGLNWNMIMPPVGGFPFFINSNTGWIIPTTPDGMNTTADTIRKTTNGGINWTAPWGTNAQVAYNSIYFSDINNGWAVGKSGIILKTTNGGINWTYVTNTGLTSSYNSKTVFFLNSNTGWIGTKDNISQISYVLFTSNGGANWNWQVAPTSGNSIFNIHFFDTQNGGLTSEDKILHTSNGGVWIKNITNELPISNSLYQNYPNPFNPATTIEFDLVKQGFISLVIYNLLGEEVAILVKDYLKPGTYQVSFDGSNLKSGVYFYTIKAGEFVNSKKMILIK